VSNGVFWVDLTVPEPAPLRDFYAAVLGCEVAEVDMGGYADYTLMDPAGAAVAGVCHARGQNADVPPVWMVYFRVDDVEVAAARCLELGGEIVRGPTPPSDFGRTCYIRDPQGVPVALFQPGPAADPGT
jgi:predicted enzyme related to lactoylglutathione lyase